MGSIKNNWCPYNVVILESLGGYYEQHYPKDEKSSMRRAHPPTFCYET